MKLEVTGVTTATAWSPPTSGTQSNAFEGRPGAALLIIATSFLLLIINPVVFGLLFGLDTIEHWLYISGVDLSLIVFGLWLPAVSVIRRQPKIMVVSLVALGMLPGLMVAAEFAAGYHRFHPSLAKLQNLPENRSPLYAPHPALGWWHPPNAKVYADIRELGAEIRTEFDDWGRRKIDQLPAKTKVHFFGDSYIFGFEVSDSETALQVLARESKIRGRFELLNYGVVGYGLEQMLTRLQLAQSEIAKGDVVVLTFIAHDLVRSDKSGSWVCREPWYGPGVQTFPVYEHGRLQVKRIDELCNRTASMLLYSGLPIGKVLTKIYEWWYRDWGRLEQNADAIIRNAKELAAARGAKFIAIEFPERSECLARRQKVDLKHFESRVFSMLDLCPPSREGVDRVYLENDKLHWNARGNRMAAKGIWSILQENGIR